MSSVDDTDYASVLNSLKLNNANSILNGAGGTSADIIPGISGDLLQQWAMLGANSNAYKALLAEEGLGTSAKKGTGYTELLSDKLFNDYYDPETKTYKTATYTPTTDSKATIDEEKTAGDVLSDMRTLALAAIGGSSLASTHYDFFETMRASIANSLVTKGSSSSGTEVTTEEAKAATVSAEADHRLLVDEQSFTIAGADAEKSYNFGIGTSLEDVVSAINADSSTTGVKAELAETEDGGYSITLTSAGAGADQVVRVDQHLGDLFAAAGSSASAKGADAVTSEAEVVASGDDTRAAMAAGLFGGKVLEDVAFTVQGRNGTQSFSFGKGTSAEDIVAAINEAASTTGVGAEVIYGADGAAEGIGLLAEKAGSGHYIQVTQDKGYLFDLAGKTSSVAGSSASASSADGPAISSLSDLGRITLDGKTYSFADLAPGGKASLANNPDAALAVLDQAIQDIYSGRAELNGFDPMETYIAGATVGAGSQASTNTATFGDWGSSALQSFISRYSTD